MLVVLLVRRYGYCCCCCCCAAAVEPANLDTKEVEKKDRDEENKHDYANMTPTVSNSVPFPNTPLSGYSNNIYDEVSENKKGQLQKDKQGKLYYAKTYSLDAKVVNKQEGKQSNWDNKENPKQGKYYNIGDVSCPKANLQNECQAEKPHYSNMDNSIGGDVYLEPNVFAPSPTYDHLPKYEEIATVTAGIPAVVTPLSFTGETYNTKMSDTSSNLQEQLQIIKNSLKRTKSENVDRSNDFQSVI